MLNPRITNGLVIDGSKGIGERSDIPVAVANSVYDAVCVRIRDLPITEGKVLARLKAKKSG